MGDIQELFETTYRRMRSRSGVYIKDKNKELQKMINRAIVELETGLKRYRVSARVLGQIEAKLTELKGKMETMNEGKVSRLVQDCLRDVENNEENLQEDARQGSRKVKGNLEERKKKSKQAKDNEYINQCTREAFDDIRRNIMSYAQTYGIPSGAMRSGDFERITESILLSYRKVTVGLKNIHDGAMDDVTRMLETEVDLLCEDIERENRKQTTKPALNPKKAPALNADFFDNSWELEDDEKAEINRNSIQIAKKIEEDSKKTKIPQENILRDDVIK